MKPSRNTFSGPFSRADLILNSDGAVYHLGLKHGDLAETIIIVGDPDRVDLVSGKFDSVHFRKNNREFVTHTGRLNGMELSVVSSGIGADNIDILINECDIVHNLDPKTRSFSTERKTLRFVRLGTSGAIQSDIPLGSLLRSDAAFGSDGLPWFCDLRFDDVELRWQSEFLNSTKWPAHAARPYFTKAPGSVKELFQDGFIPGMTATMNGFYAGQGRWIGLRSFDSGFVDSLTAMRFSQDERITNFEMETAAIYAFCAALGHEAVSLLAILANRVSGEFVVDTAGPVEHLIELALDRLTQG